MRHLLIVPALLLAAGALAGCRVGSAFVDSLPPSEAYVDELHASQEKAIAQARTDFDDAVKRATEEADKATSSLRTHTDDALAELRSNTTEALGTLRFDLQASERAQAAAYAEALQQGKSQAEAMAAGVLAKLTEQSRSADAATAAAAAKAQQALDAAVAEAKKAREEAVAAATERLTKSEEAAAAARKTQAEELAAAKEKAGKASTDALNALSGVGSTTPWYAQLGGAAVLALISYLTAKGAGKASTQASVAAAAMQLQQYDAQPFQGPNGEKLDEGQLVAFLTSQMKNRG
ncbi:MAG: hypothetical protein IPK67_18665 [Planctomycetes bacterium]|nr:hypothetical protein [Planctomycetota bacterium]